MFLFLAKIAKNLTLLALLIKGKKLFKFNFDLTIIIEEELLMITVYYTSYCDTTNLDYVL